MRGKKGYGTTIRKAGEYNLKSRSLYISPAMILLNLTTSDGQEHTISLNQANNFAIVAKVLGICTPQLEKYNKATTEAAILKTELALAKAMEQYYKTSRKTKLVIAKDKDGKPAKTKTGEKILQIAPAS